MTELPYQTMAAIFKNKIPYNEKEHKLYFLGFFEECWTELIKRFMAEQGITRQQIIDLFYKLQQWRGFFVTFFLFFQVLCGELPEDRRDDVGIPALEEHQIARYLSAGVLFQREVNTVLLGGGGKDPDVLVDDLDVGNAGVVLHKLPEGLLAVVQLGLAAAHSFLHLVQYFFHGLLQHPGGELGSLHTEGNSALGDFFLHKSSSPFSSAIQVVVYQGRIVAVDGGRSVIQGS